MTAALATASPAAAVDDPTRPDAEVTRGPSCRPGGIVVEVVAGTAAYSVRLSTTRTPAGEDEVTLVAAAAATLQTGDVAPGETIDPRLEFTPLDGSGDTYVDELEDYTLTRPATEDCQAVMAPAAPAPSEPSATVQPPGPGTTGPTTGGRTPSSTPTTAGPSDTTPPSPRTTPSSTAGVPPRSSGAALPPVDRPGPAAPQQVAAGGTVTLDGAGFAPGERVDILLRGTGTVLASATAGADGQVRVDVRIPEGAAAGSATLDLVGRDSALVTDVRLQVAADEAAVDTWDGVLSLVPIGAAAAALVATTAGLVSVAGRQQSLHRRRAPLRTA